MEREFKLVEEVRRNIARYELIKPGERVIVGVSGGPDSVALLHVLHTLAPELELSLWVAHLNHELRGGESEADLEYVQSLAAKLGTPLVSARVNVRELARTSKLTIEEAARQARHDFLSSAAWTVGATKIALGHNLNDQAETVLMRFLRGSGIEGLAGIPPKREERIIRPLLSVDREEIERYCQRHGLKPRQDSSNLDPAFARNRIRLRLIPLLREQYNPQITRRLACVAEQMRADAEVLRELVDEVYRDVTISREDETVIRLEEFRRLPLSLQRRVIRRAFEEVSDGHFGLDFESTERVRDICINGESGKAIALPRGVLVNVRGGVIRFRRGKEMARLSVAGGREYVLNVPGLTEIPEFGLRLRAEVFQLDDALKRGIVAARPGVRQGKTVREGRDHLGGLIPAAVLDYGKTGDNLMVRVRRPGDYFSPFGLGGRKKVKEFFIDAKIPKSQRDRIPLVVKNDDIVWIVGWRIDERFKVDELTSEVLELKAYCMEGTWRFPVNPSECLGQTL